MLATVAYRGPDDEVFELQPGLGVGFRRLEIVDEAHGRQPLKTGDGRLTLVCNGEIYNHVELRRLLLARGHAFRTASDSEVVLHAYAEWGAASPDRLRGIFAFAVWDSVERRLFLCRDRSGIKPLFVRADGDELLFASEAKAILANPRTPRRIDLLSCFSVAETDALLEPSPFEQVFQLGAGCSATFGPFASLLPHRYWRYDPTIEPVAASTEADYIDAYREEMLRALPMQLMADRPVGSFLSGGLDSSVVCAVVGAGTAGLETFTSVCAGSDDPWFAYLVSQDKSLRNHFVRFEPDAMLDSLPDVAWGAEGMFDLGFLARYQLATAAHQSGLKVLLSGQGADELTGGYQGSYAAFVAAFERIDAAARLLDTGWPELAAALRTSATENGRPAAPKGRPKAPGTEAAKVAFALKRWHAGLSAYLLRFEDRMGMLAGLEVRVPFLDHVLVEICASVPPEHRRTLFGDKRLLREAATGLMPESVRTREKFPFNWSLGPITQALARSSRETWAGELLTDAAVRDKSYFEPEVVRLLRETRNFRLLDGVLMVHMLDELFGASFSPGRFSAAPPPAVTELVDHDWSRARSAATTAPSRAPTPSDAPSRGSDVTHIGLLHDLLEAPVDGGGATVAQPSPVLTIRFNDGRHTLTPLPPELDPELVVAVARSADGSNTYRDMASTLVTPVEVVLAAGQFLRERAALTHRR